ncbi:PspA/IM30 family protein [Sinorhizobium garamanticum]|uniref:PspA/IM30 family protein n=1 Tax=Sinorhizobium garamanticum TaxID=680247 RepID=A0ABY8DGP3_9HYPH|nr:PspA/IM30 family protein [Sinorhizobium garamanticum]WEX90075.1 PspA/IM30 family protein [Sinorhizobium garamanticum]
MSQAGQKSILRYRLVPDLKARRALEETFSAYAEMHALLGELTAGKGGGANLVTLHELAYETIRERTGLPARLVTLGLRDFAANRGQQIDPVRLPLDNKLFAIKGPSDVTVATVRGRVAVPFDVAGYSPGALDVFAAELVAEDDNYEIRLEVTVHSDRTKENMIMNEGILSRMGRLIAGIANAAVDKAEGANKIVIVEQAIREIDAAAEEARSDIGRSRAEEYRIESRREEILESLRALDEKIRTAIAAERDDLAKAGVGRQIDLEAQVAALDKALADARERLSEGQQALHAVLAARREAEARLADLKKSVARHTEEPAARRTQASAVNEAARAAAVISRVTGVPGDTPAAGAELDELDRLHREQAIAARLAQFKADRN